MAKICYIPFELSGTNQVSDSYHITSLARDYDEIVIAYPDGSDKNDTARTLNAIQLINKPVWIVPFFYQNKTGLTTSQHRNQTYTRITSQMTEVYNWLNDVGLGSLLKGFAFDYLDYSFRWGDLSTIAPYSTPSPSDPWRINRLFINNCIAYARGLNKPVMMISNRVSDVLSLVYPTDYSDLPGAAAWPAVLGTDSSKVDWIVIRDPIFAPQSMITNNANITPLAYAWHRLCQIAQAKQFRSSNINVGALQEYSFHSMNPDFLLGQYISNEDGDRLKGISTFMDLFALDGWGIKPITNPSVPIVISKNLLESLPQGKGNGQVNYPSAGTSVNVWSWNGVLNVRYRDSSNEEWNYKFDQDFALV